MAALVVCPAVADTLGSSVCSDSKAASTVNLSSGAQILALKPVCPNHRQQQFPGRFRIHRSWVPPPERELVRCSYSSGGLGYSSEPIDVVAEVKTEKILVLGGSGFVGSEICKQAVKRDIEVVSLSRSGRPSYGEAWVDRVLWMAGDVFFTDWESLLNNCSAVISTLGGFGTNEQMEKINGDANIIAVDAAYKAGVRKFIYISVHEYNFPEFLLNNGYFKGKRRTEQEIFDKYPSSGTILRPGFIYGKRRVNGVDVPLDLVGQPLEKVLAATGTITRPLAKVPASDLLFAPPVSVKDVALAALKALKDDTYFGTLSIEQIKEAAAALAAV